MLLGPHLLPTPWILAPMAGVSEMPFRVLARELGAAAAPTELVSAKGLLYGSNRTERYLTHAPAERPFWVQIFGGDEHAMTEGAARAADLGAEIIDVNMGCPVKKVTRDGAGAALACDPPRAARIIAGITRRTGLPVTAKIRAGWDADSLNFIEVARAIADAGAVAIALHARTRAQGYSGVADWSLIRRLVLASPVPVIGNGDAFTAARARAMLADTGCAAVMIGRGALGNPWIFRELTGGLGRPTRAERWALVERHLHDHLEFVGDERSGIRRFRPHLLWYSHGLAGAAEFRRRVTRIDDLGELTAECQAFFVGADVQADGAEAIEFDERTALG